MAAFNPSQCHPNFLIISLKTSFHILPEGHHHSAHRWHELNTVIDTFLFLRCADSSFSIEHCLSLTHAKIELVLGPF